MKKNTVHQKSDQLHIPIICACSQPPKLKGSLLLKLKLKLIFCDSEIEICEMSEKLQY